MENILKHSPHYSCGNRIFRLATALRCTSDRLRHYSDSHLVGLGKAMKDTGQYDGLWSRFEFISHSRCAV